MIASILIATITTAAAEMELPAPDVFALEATNFEQRRRATDSRYSCRLGTGQTVPHGWSGSGTGANHCNQCSCDWGALKCTSKKCSPTTPSYRSCRKSDGTTVPHGWSGKGAASTGNSCNDCNCYDGNLGCTGKMCPPTTPSYRSCRKSDGTTVPHGWSGKGAASTGNHCNDCNCNDGDLTCSQMMCSPTSPNSCPMTTNRSTCSSVPGCSLRTTCIPSDGFYPCSWAGSRGSCNSNPQCEWSDIGRCSERGMHDYCRRNCDWRCMKIDSCCKSSASTNQCFA